MDHASGELSCHGITLHLVSDCGAEKQTDQGSLNVAHSTTIMVVARSALAGSSLNWRNIAIALIDGF
jgi:hypothetical protein